MPRRVPKKQDIQQIEKEEIGNGILSNQDMILLKDNQEHAVELYKKHGFIRECEEAADRYIANCERFNVDVDPGVVICLRTGWYMLHPTKYFNEGAMLPLLGVLDQNQHDKRIRSSGNGNSNARVLNFILRQNQAIEELNLSNTGLDDDGLKEIAQALKDNRSLKRLDVSGNYFGLDGALSLRDALESGSSLEKLDLSMNALSFQAIHALQSSCACNGLEMLTQGNYIFEEILNSVSHGVALIFAVIGSVILMTEATETYNTDYHFWGCLIFSFTLMFLFAVSTLFHSFFMLPTGSYTPFLLIGLHNYTSATVLLIAQWIAAAAGTMFVTGADLNKPSTSNIELTAFVCMGGAAVFVWHHILEAFTASAVKLLVAGGAAYVIGIVFFIWGQYKPIYHSVWHLFVMLGASLHWFCVYFFIVNTRLGGVMEGVYEDCMRDGLQTCVQELYDVVNMTAIGTDSCT